MSRARRRVTRPKQAGSARTLDRLERQAAQGLRLAHKLYEVVYVMHATVKRAERR